MNFRILVMFVVMATVSSLAYAEIIILKDGRMINAKVIEQDDKKMKIEEDGESVTYYLDQIESVNGKPLVPVSQTSKGVKKEGAGANGALSIPALEDPKPSGLSKRALIKKFIDVFGTRAMMTQNFERMIATLPPDKAQEVKEILNVDEVIDNIMPLYDKHFTQEDLESYIAFFGSERGQKFLKALPLVMKESVDVNIEYFKTKMPE